MHRRRLREALRRALCAVFGHKPPLLEMVSFWPDYPSGWYICRRCGLCYHHEWLGPDE